MGQDYKKIKVKVQNCQKLQKKENTLNGLNEHNDKPIHWIGRYVNNFVAWASCQWSKINQIGYNIMKNLRKNSSQWFWQKPEFCTHENLPILNWVVAE